MESWARRFRHFGGPGSGAGGAGGGGGGVAVS